MSKTLLSLPPTDGYCRCLHHHVMLHAYVCNHEVLFFFFNDKHCVRARTMIHIERDAHQPIFVLNLCIRPTCNPLLTLWNDLSDHHFCMMCTNGSAHTHADALCRRISYLIVQLHLNVKQAEVKHAWSVYRIPIMSAAWAITTLDQQCHTAASFLWLIHTLYTPEWQSMYWIHHVASTVTKISQQLCCYSSLFPNFISSLLHCCSLWYGLLFPLCHLFLLLLLLCCPLFVTIFLLIFLTFHFLPSWKIFLASPLFIPTSLILWLFRLIVTCALKTQAISLPKENGCCEK